MTYEFFNIWLIWSNLSIFSNSIDCNPSKFLHLFNFKTWLTMNIGSNGMSYSFTTWCIKVIIHVRKGAHIVPDNSLSKNISFGWLVNLMKTKIQNPCSNISKTILLKLAICHMYVTCVFKLKLKLVIRK